MPIPVDELKKAQEPLAERIVQFLSSNPSKAYTFFEVIAEVEGYSETDQNMLKLTLAIDSSNPRGMVARYKEALDALERDGKIEVASIRGTDYYARPKK